MVIEKQIVIKNKQGLHARPAALFVQLANKYESEITIRKDKEEINGKSIMGILMLAAEEGCTVFVKVQGSDAEEAMKQLEAVLINQTDDIATAKIDSNKDKRRRNI